MWRWNANIYWKRKLHYLQWPVCMRCQKVELSFQNRLQKKNRNYFIQIIIVTVHNTRTASNEQQQQHSFYRFNYRCTFCEIDWMLFSSPFFPFLYKSAKAFNKLLPCSAIFRQALFGIRISKCDLTIGGKKMFCWLLWIFFLSINSVLAAFWTSASQYRCVCATQQWHHVHSTHIKVLLFFTQFFCSLFLPPFPTICVYNWTSWRKKRPNQSMKNDLYVCSSVYNIIFTVYATQITE